MKPNTRGKFYISYILFAIHSAAFIVLVIFDNIFFKSDPQSSMIYFPIAVADFPLFFIAAIYFMHYQTSINGLAGILIVLFLGGAWWFAIGLAISANKDN